jgi:probable F420-dependent oxidoreductase
VSRPGTHRPFRFGVVAAQASSGEEWVARARRAEALGYSTFLIPDTLGPTLAPLPALAAVAAGTGSLRIGTYVLAVGYRNPLLLARECATLDFLSGGRFELGIGAGRPGVEEDYRKLGLAPESGGARVERLAEALRLLKGLLGGEGVGGTGRPDRSSAEELFPRPVQRPRPPILVAGAGRRLLALAAREADVVALGGRPDEDEATVAEKVAWLRDAAGDRFGGLELNVNLIAVGQQVQPWVAARYGLDPAALARSRAPAVLLGSPDEMRDQLLARRETLGVSYFSLADSFMETLAPVVERLAGR